MVPQRVEQGGARVDGQVVRLTVDDEVHWMADRAPPDRVGIRTYWPPEDSTTGSAGHRPIVRLRRGGRSPQWQDRRGRVRGSSIDPRVFTRYRRGELLDGARSPEAALRDLLRG